MQRASLEAAAAGASHSPSRADRGPAGCVVTIIDDDPTFVDLIAEVLADELGCRVLVCTHAEQAEPMVVGVQPDLVLLDLVFQSRMGGSGGLAALKANPATRHVPVVLCTAARPQQGQRDELMRLGAAGILDKPFDLSELIELVARHCAAAPANVLRAPSAGSWVSTELDH